MIKDKNNLLKDIENNVNITLELGCGSKKRIDNAIGIDQLDFECVDIVGDLFEVLSRFKDNSVKKIFSSHVFEHVEDLQKLIEECSRVLRNEGTLEIIVPHFSNPYFYSDYTHKRFFGLYSLSYFAESKIFKRRVPLYGLNLPLKIENVVLIFRGERPFYIRHMFGRILTLLFNSSNFIKEFYEVNLCYLFPCYEIKYVVKKCLL